MDSYFFYRTSLHLSPQGRGKERKWVLLAGVAARARQVGVESNDNYIADVHEETKVTRMMYIGNE